MVISKEEQDYIEDSFARDYIKDYLGNGTYSVEDAIIKGMEDFIEELMQEIIELKGEDSKPTEPQTQGS